MGKSSPSILMGKRRKGTKGAGFSSRTGREKRKVRERTNIPGNCEPGIKSRGGKSFRVAEGLLNDHAGKEKEGRTAATKNIFLFN